MAFSSNVGLLQLPWGKLPRAPKSGASGRQLEKSFRDIMDEQQRETSQEDDFDEYIQKSYVTVMTPPPTPKEEGSDLMEKSFLQLEDLDTDLKLVMSFYEDQDFDDVTYELSEQDLNDLDDDDSDKYYEGLAKKLSTVVEISTSPPKGNKGSRTKSGGSSLSYDQQIQRPSAGSNEVDEESKVILDKLRQKGILRGVYKPIHKGETSTLFVANGGMLRRREETCNNVNNSMISILKLRLPKEVAIKVFNKTDNNLQESSSSLVVVEEEQRLIEAKREMTHLNRMTRAGIPCPQVQFIHRHILITEFIGKDNIPAKKLRNAHDLSNSRANLKTAYEQITTNMKTLFKTCHLVHGDLSEDNILWHKRQPYFINVANAVNSNRTEALELLYRDCVQITEFFEKKGKPECHTPQELFRWITGFDFTGQHISCCAEDFAIV